MLSQTVTKLWSTDHSSKEKPALTGESLTPKPLKNFNLLFTNSTETTFMKSPIISRQHQSLKASISVFKTDDPPFFNSFLRFYQKWSLDSPLTLLISLFCLLCFPSPKMLCFLWNYSLLRLHLLSSLSPPHGDFSQVHLWRFQNLYFHILVYWTSLNIPNSNLNLTR